MKIRLAGALMMGESPSARRGKQDCHLQREHMLPGEILVEAVLVTGFILQQERRWPGLSGGMAKPLVWVSEQFGDAIAFGGGEKIRQKSPDGVMALGQLGLIPTAAVPGF